MGATVNVAPGDDKLSSAVTSSTSGDELKLVAGTYSEKGTGDNCISISKPLTILGV